MIMWLFDKIKSFFKKSVDLLPKSPDDLVSRVKFRGNKLKFGTQINFSEDYSLIFVHFNQVYDILKGGSYKVDETVIPKLYTRVALKQVKQGMSKPNFVSCDTYLLSHKEIRLVPFLTSKVVAFANDSKVKFKIKGAFNFKICDEKKFLDYFVGEFAVLRNKTVLNEISFLLKEQIYKKIKRFNYEFDDYFSKREEIQEKLLKEIDFFKNNLGIELTNIYINQINVSKNFLNLKIIAEKKAKAEEELFDMATKSLNNSSLSQEDKIEVLVRKENLNKQIEQAKQENANLNSFNESQSSFRKEDFFDDDRNFQNSSPTTKEPILFKDNDSNTQNNSQSNTIDDVIKNVNIVPTDVNFISTQSFEFDSEANLLQKAPSLIIEDTPRQVEVCNVDNKSKEEIPTIKCVCCGAENLGSNKYCSVCNSKLH